MGSFPYLCGIKRKNVMSGILAVIALIYIVWKAFKGDGIDDCSEWDNGHG